MKYTAGELRKMNGRKCKLQNKKKPEAEGEIYVVDGSVSFVNNDDNYDGDGRKKGGYKYSYILYETEDTDDNTTGEHNSITFLDEPHQNIYYDDNGEIIKEGDWVLVSNKVNTGVKRIFLCKVPRRGLPYICVDDSSTELYLVSTEDITATGWRHCIKYKEPEKKLRELMLTDEQHKDALNRYK